ncbi:hypothetical protein WJX72_011557 [[Myrmecia] bisecta]|uniref:FAD-binding PCMH-type domain-containing protein n=1 Tax=[Myrmecia] bisecta TaxID=41462 RepID=A0AAW1Q188_9CHLO
MNLPNGSASMQDGLHELVKSFRGTISLPGQAMFEVASKLWSKSAIKPPTDQPAVVFTTRGTADVAAALKFAQDYKLEVAVKSGGHCPRNSCWPDGGAVIDLSLMRSVYVDPIACTAVADGGCLLDDIDNETRLHSLMVPLGHAPVTGMGLAVNGGFGVASKVYGATCDHIVAIQLVTASGEVLTADADHHPDLFWALRGAGSAFGVITKLTFRLNRIPATFYGGAFMWADDPQHNNFRTIARFIRDQVIPDPHLSLQVIRAAHPEKGPMLLSMVMYFGDDLVETKAAFLTPMRDLAPFHDTVGKETYAEVQTTLMPMFGPAPPHFEYGTMSMFSLDQVTDELIDTVITELIDQAPLDKLPATMFLFDALSGEALKRSTAPVGLTQGDAYVGVIVGWLDAKQNAAGLAYGQHCKQVLARCHGTADAYSNMLHDDNGSDAALAKRVGSEANLKRLRELKQQWDPTRVFVNTPFRQL